MTSSTYQVAVDQFVSLGLAALRLEKEILLSGCHWHGARGEEAIRGNLSLHSLLEHHHEKVPPLTSNITKIRKSSKHRISYLESYPIHGIESQIATLTFPNTTLLFPNIPHYSPVYPNVTLTFLNIS